MSPFADALRLALSAAISASESARACSERLAGKTVLLEASGQRWRLRFQAGEVAVDVPAEDDSEEADATVRGTLPSLLRAFVSKEGAEAVAVIGDAELFEDFRTSFRPHLAMPSSFGQFAEDAGDAVRVGTQAARSAVDGVGRAVRDKAQEYFARRDEERAAEVAALRERVAALEVRVEALERGPGPEAEVPPASTTPDSEAT